MSDKIEDGGPAFPKDVTAGGYRGMSLRDYVAINATDGDIETIPWTQWTDGRYVELSRSERRYAFADAMLAARRG